MPDTSCNRSWTGLDIGRTRQATSVIQSESGGWRLLGGAATGKRASVTENVVIRLAS